MRNERAARNELEESRIIQHRAADMVRNRPGNEDALDLYREASEAVGRWEIILENEAKVS